MDAFAADSNRRRDSQRWTTRRICEETIRLQWDTSIGRDIETGNVGLEELEAYILKKVIPTQTRSVRQEMLENIITSLSDEASPISARRVAARLCPELTSGQARPRRSDEVARSSSDETR